MNNPNPDAGIPVLTEIITPAAEDDILDSPPTVSLRTAAPTPKPQPSTSQAPTADLSVEQLNQLEHQVTERVLRQMQEQIDLALEQRVRDSLADVLQTAVDGLAQEIRHGLQQAVKDVVSRAVEQEMARLQQTKN
jgi:hypothetical protein